jgi:glycosyltransferase involved in cell wall biosynthesis
VKLLYVTSRYRPHTGGVETHVAELAERFAARGHDVTVLSADAGTHADGRTLPPHSRQQGVTVRRFRGLAPGGAFHFAPGIVDAVRTAEADVVHAHNYHSLPLVFAALGVSLHPDDPRFVVTPHYHGGSASTVRDRLLSLYRFPGGWALRRADEVIAVSDWERRRLQSDFGVTARVVPNGLDVSRFRTATPVRRERPYLLSVGRLERYKGVQHVVRALPELPEYDLLVAGSGPHLDALRRLAGDVGVANRVEFLGYVADEDLPGLYAGAAAFVTMSSFEAYGMTVAEALAAGTPCVVRDQAALADWAETCSGVVATTIHPSAVVQSIRSVVQHDVNHSNVPDWNNVVERLLREYQAE